jgi:hypothetical protein
MMRLVVSIGFTEMLRTLYTPWQAYSQSTIHQFFMSLKVSPWLYEGGAYRSDAAKS